LAAAAIGVSHMVQSTRAGADYGFTLVWAVLIASLMKYPFLEYGPRYATATGESLIAGYKKLGSWALWIYIIFTVGTMFAIQAAVTIVTASLAVEYHHFDYLYSRSFSRSIFRTRFSYQSSYGRAYRFNHSSFVGSSF
jgi:hypothetical protein